MNTTEILYTSNQSSMDGWGYIEPLAKESYILIIVLCVATLCVGSVGNAVVIALFIKYKSLRTVPNLLVMNLTVADLLMCVMVLPVIIINCSQIYLSEQLTLLLCNFEGFTTALMGFVSIVTMTALAVDRCFAICFSLRHSHRRKRKLLYVRIASIWLVSIAGAVLPFTGLGKYVKDPYKLFCTFDSFSYTKNNIVYNILINVFFFVIPLLTVITSYMKIYLTVRKHENQYININRQGPVLQQGSLLRVNRSGIYNRQHVKSAKAAFKLVSVFILSWLPYSLVSQWCLYGDLENISPIYVSAPAIFAKFATILNPLLYRPVQKKCWTKLSELYSRKCRPVEHRVSTFSSGESTVRKKSSKSSYHTFQMITTV